MKNKKDKVLTDIFNSDYQGILSDLEVTGIKYKETRRGISYIAQTNKQGVEIVNDGFGGATFVEGINAKNYRDLTEHNLETLINDYERKNYDKGGTTSSFWEKSKELGSKGWKKGKELGEKGYKKSKELAHEANERRKGHLHFKRKEISRNVGIETSAIIDEKVKKGEITKKKADKLNDTLVDATIIQTGHYKYPEGPKAKAEMQEMTAKMNRDYPYFAKGGEIRIANLKKGDFVQKKGSNIALEVLSVGKDWRSGYDVVELYDDLFPDRTQRLIDLSEYEMSDRYDLYTPSYAKGGEVKKKGNEMIMGGLAGILLGIFLNK